MKQIINILILSAVALTGCSKSGGGSAADTYYLNKHDNECYRSRDGARVDDNYCDGTDDYYLSTNGKCYKEDNKEVVDINTYCHAPGDDDSDGYYINYKTFRCYSSSNFSSSNEVDQNRCYSEKYAVEKVCSGTYRIDYGYGYLETITCSSSSSKCDNALVFEKSSGLFVKCDQN